MRFMTGAPVARNTAADAGIRLNSRPTPSTKPAPCSISTALSTGTYSRRAARSQADIRQYERAQAAIGQPPSPSWPAWPVSSM
jgi:hypothetical protein